ncbi:hypothetical protein ABIA39_003948 [Nocardia sp. GAS34]|uniref:hypothetical protein n=1 Tax=unclassified Nocardia TaxID=2637762 RepID=UPI003D1993F9
MAAEASPDLQPEKPKSSLDLPEIDPVAPKSVGDKVPIELDHGLRLPESTMISPDPVRQNESQSAVPDSTESLRSTAEAQTDHAHHVPADEHSAPDLGLDHSNDISEPDNDRTGPRADSDSESPRETPPRIDRQYLSKVLDERVNDPRRVIEYASAEPRSFEPGCEDRHLPDDLTRSMPDHALDDSKQAIDPSEIFFALQDDGHAIMWRDKSANDAYLEPHNALFPDGFTRPEDIRPGFRIAKPR